MNLIEEIKNRLSIDNVVRNVLHLEIERQAKGGYFIKSIYRDERTPSLMIYVNENRFVDFGNNEHGDQIQLYQDYYNVDTKTAIEDLKKIAGLDERRETKDVKREARVPQQPALNAVEKALKDCSNDEKYFYEECLGIIEENCLIKDTVQFKINENKALDQLRVKRINDNREVFEEMYFYCLTHNSNEHYIKYLTEQRGLRRFGIKNSKLFFIDNYNQVNNHLKKTFKNDPDKLKHCGLFNDKGNLIFYNHRLIIPYQHKGKIVYLRARYFDQENNFKTSEFKYIGLINDSLNCNTPKRFFNIDTLDKMIAGQSLYITEGEFDALLLTDKGYNSMAIPGAGNIPPYNKFLRLKDFKIIAVPDNDVAGSKMLDGKYIDKNGNEKYSDINLTSYFRLLEKEFYIKRLPDNVKDITDYFLMAS